MQAKETVMTRPYSNRQNAPTVLNTDLMASVRNCRVERSVSRIGILIKSIDFAIGHSFEIDSVL